MRHSLLSALAASGLVALIAAPVSAQPEARRLETERYQACLALVESDPDAALDEAQLWQETGGGWPPAVCAGLAMMALGDPELGAAILDDLGREPRPGLVEEDRVRLLVQAGEGFTRAGDVEAALASYGRAIELQPQAVRPRIARADLYLAENRVSDLAIEANHLVSTAPAIAEGWRLRSEYHLARGQLDNAWADMQEARNRAPDRIDLLVLRGRINEARRLAAIGADAGETAD